MSRRRHVMARGIGFRSSVVWMREWGGEELWRETTEELTPSERDALDGIVLTKNYELDIPDKLYAAFARACCDEDLEITRLVFEQLGIYMASDPLARVMYLTRDPRLLVRFFPTQWQMLFPGVEVESERPGASGRCVVNIVRGLGGFSHVSPVARGWMEQALRMAGAKGPSVEEASYNRGEIASDEHRYEISW